MEASFVANPYVQTSAPSSHTIREILDREEASYEAWRKSRKPVRLPHASSKLNRPLQTVAVSRHDSNQSKFNKAMQAAFRKTGSSSGHSLSRPQSVAAVTPKKVARRKDALITGGFTRSAEMFPSVSIDQSGRQKQEQLSQAIVQPRRTSEATIIPSIAPRKATRRKFQQYLYDFHSRQVFSFAKNEVEEFEDAMKVKNPEKLETCSREVNDEDSEDINSEDNSPPRWSSISRQEMNAHHNEYLLTGLGFLSGPGYDELFSVHWKLSEAEKIVRDAVDRKRIREILRKAYRMLLWFFRYYAGNAAYAVASERRTGPGMVIMGDGLFEIPSRLRLLEDLNVQCVDETRFGVTDSPLKRESLIDFLINVARMMCTHSSDPSRLKMTINDGIEMSEAVKTLVHEHFGVFAQIQDVDHFRTIFLHKPGIIARALSVGVRRRLHAILETHKNNLANFFDELISAGVNLRGGNDRTKSQQRQRTHGSGIACTQFLSTLRAINLIASRGVATGANIDTNADDEVSAGGPAGVDEVRAVRIFLSCLPMATFDSNENESATRPSATASNNTTSSEPRELTLSQFIEALLRVAFTWKELQICHGRFDVCCNQMASDRCRCNIDPAQYTFHVFDDAAEEVFTRIHSYRLKRVQQRTAMRMQMKSHISLHTVVALTAIQRAPNRLLPLDEKQTSNDGRV
ncbi:hypothetical protein GN244_ATG05539 [Phytophthora infestans]|uniref:Uncharacterized protein n=1 Tax=Phytophthora infestans TaxID=4787 RepID=A0A833WI97_PHYIN|nr:hypothetical protein GN244_ATG05539 [Phytophthora infestans]